ncbi:MAG: amidohydrolase family protein [Bacteroidia bacterium]
MESHIFRNVTVVNEGTFQTTDVWMHKGRFYRIGDVPAGAVGRQWECQGLYLLPGFIDTHVHFRWPGLTHKGDIASESRAAVQGGVTSFMDMPNTVPPTVDFRRWREKMEYAASCSWANYGFYVGATDENLDEVLRCVEAGACGVKVFLAASTGALWVRRWETVEALLQEVPSVVAFHSEDAALIRQAENYWRMQTALPVDIHRRIRTAEACAAATQRLLTYAQKYPRARMHILHLTTAREIELLWSRPPNLSTETCPQYLVASDDAYANLGNKVKCNPAIKTAQDREALWQGLHAGVIDLIGSDHAPHTLEEKSRSYWEAPAGVPGVAETFLILWGQGRVQDIAFWVEKLAHAPARLFKIVGRGFIREGYYADAVLWDPSIQGTFSVPPYSCGWSLYQGCTQHGQIRATFVNGQLVYEDSVFHPKRCARALECSF